MRILITGARAATPYGEGVAERLGRELSRRGYTILTPYSYGIGVAVLRGVLSPGRIPMRGGRTTEWQRPVVYVPHGLLPGGVLYPPVRALGVDLRHCELVYTGVHPGMGRFLERGRRMVDEADAVIVVESFLRSGAMTEVVRAESRGIPILAVPGPVDSAASVGTNLLLRDGRARVCQGADDVETLVGGPWLGANTPDVDTPHVGEYPVTRGDVTQLSEMNTPTPGLVTLSTPHVVVA